MQLVATSIPGIFIIEPQVFGDARGYFFESFNERRFGQLLGIEGEPPHFVQDNHSRSVGNVLRGLHYQIRQPQGKLVRVTAGEIFDVAVDIRRGSATFGRWTGAMLSAENRHQMWIPPGFAHGFVVTGESAEVLYKTTDYWAQEHERCILWNDPAINVKWPLNGPPVLSDKDKSGKFLGDAEVFA